MNKESFVYRFQGHWETIPSEFQRNLLWGNVRLVGYVCSLGPCGVREHEGTRTVCVTRVVIGRDARVDDRG